MNRMTINLQLKAGKSLVNGENPICARVTINGDRMELSTKTTVDASKWDRYRQEVKGRSEYARTVNQYLKELVILLL